MFSISDLVLNNFLIIKVPQQGYDPGVTNRPIRFKLTARTDILNMQIHRSSPIVEVECKQTKS